MKSKEEIEQLAEKYWAKQPYNEDAYVVGYTQCQEDNKPFFTEDTWNTMCSRITELQAELNKKYTEEDIIEVVFKSIDVWMNSEGLTECSQELKITDIQKIINSLNKQD
jgi:hypothetical protein